MEEFQYALEELLRKDQIYIERLYPYEKGGLIQLIRQEGELLSEEYKAEGIAVKAYVPRSIYGKTMKNQRQFVIQPSCCLPGWLFPVRYAWMAVV